MLRFRLQATKLGAQSVSVYGKLSCWLWGPYHSRGLEACLHKAIDAIQGVSGRRSIHHLAVHMACSENAITQERHKEGAWLCAH